MLKTKRPVYEPQLTNTAHSKGRPIHPSPTPDVASIEDYQLDQNDDDQFKAKSEYSPSPIENSLTNDLIASKPASFSARQICLIVFGTIILLMAIAAIVFSAILYINQSSSTNSVTTTTASTTTTTTAYYSCSNFTVTVNWDYPNNDIYNILPMTFPVCCSWCLATSVCTTFAYTNSSSKCWLKTSSGGTGVATTGTIGATR